ncbi:hypothetical protein THRCLA_01677 [Thraustotheca clavata]|uniref:Tetratricopeptide repeat protein 29 n=1 Tax=Thraustotheca clavata TaxID=74557 RepID=A0A1W0A7X8_9STRA|nr:hypothetical protein THRCLA_01677 [Thraustotheca clavata]
MTKKKLSMIVKAGILFLGLHVAGYVYSVYGVQWARMSRHQLKQVAHRREEIAFMSIRVPQVGVKPTRQQTLRTRAPGTVATTSNNNGPVLCTPTDKREACAQVLRSGLVQSFVDLFYLIHRVDTLVTSDGADKKHPVGISPAQMSFLKDNLTTAEQARRHGDVIQVFESYERLASHFIAAQDLRTAVFFYEKCLEIARIARNQDFEMSALENLGKAYYGLKEYTKAQENHELHVQLTRLIRPDSIVAVAELSKVYEQVALQHERQGQYESALNIHMKFLDCSKDASDMPNVALGQYRIGCCYNAMHQPTDALLYLKDFLVLSKNLSNVDGECKAYAALATTFEALGHTKQAMDYLKEYLVVAEKIDNVIAQAEACRRLGLLYSQTQEFGLALEMMERNFELIKNNSKSDARLLDQARTSFGVIRAHHKFNAFIDFITGDTAGLLNWKATRMIENK